MPDSHGATDRSSLATDRIPAVDVARGAAIVAMVVYHFSWDLAYHGLVDWPVASSWPWRAFAMAVASSFLALVGVGLILAARRGVDLLRFSSRLLKIAAAAALVSIATYVAFPDAWIFFGILHMIVVGSLLALPVLRWPASALLVLAVAVLAVAWFGQGILPYHPALWPLGLTDPLPLANDYVPVFPWFAPILVGLAIGRLLVDGDITLPVLSAKRGPSRWLAAAGRWSLVIYLIHQPLLFNAVGQVAKALPVSPVAEKAEFVRACEAGCTGEAAGAGDAGRCQRFCACVVGALDGTSYFTIRGGNPDLASVVATAATACQGSDIFDPSDASLSD
jgi:uncharacterized membrane protein